jgi:hypothetical protein
LIDFIFMSFYYFSKVTSRKKRRGTKKHPEMTQE